MKNDGKRGELRRNVTEKSSRSGFAKCSTVKRPARLDNFSTSVSGWLSQSNWLVGHHRKNPHGGAAGTEVSVRRPSPGGRNMIGRNDPSTSTVGDSRSAVQNWE